MRFFQKKTPLELESGWKDQNERPNPAARSTDTLRTRPFHLCVGPGTGATLSQNVIIEGSREQQFRRTYPINYEPLKVESAEISGGSAERVPRPTKLFRQRVSNAERMMREDPQTRCRPSLSGAWVLDVARSDTLEEYLRCLAAPEAAIYAQEELEAAYPSRNVIALDESKLVIYKHTASNNSTEAFEIGEEKVAHSSTGTVKRSTVSLAEGGQPDGYVLVSETVSTGGHSSLVHVEARQLSPGGHVHTQELSVRNLVTGAQSVTMRFWTRVAITELDLARLSTSRSA